MSTNPAQFKSAMASFPSGVTIVSTTDSEGHPRGFTASSFSSVSMNPPLVLVCIAKSAESYDAFANSSSFAINILTREHEELAVRFAKKSNDKFSGSAFTMCEPTAPPFLPDALAALICTTYSICDAGDHTILVGSVESAHTNDAMPLVYFNRNFWNLEREHSTVEA